MASYTQERFSLPAFLIFLASSQCSCLRKINSYVNIQKGSWLPMLHGSLWNLLQICQETWELLLSASQALLQFRTSETSRTWGSLRKLTSLLWIRHWYKASNNTKLSRTAWEDAAINSVLVCNGKKCGGVCVDIILGCRTNHSIKNVAKHRHFLIHLILYLPVSYCNMRGVLCMPLHICADQRKTVEVVFAFYLYMGYRVKPFNCWFILPPIFLIIKTLLDHHKN